MDTELDITLTPLYNEESEAHRASAVRDLAPIARDGLGFDTESNLESIIASIPCAGCARAVHCADNRTHCAQSAEWVATMESGVQYH